jgi:hypothetical protein
VATRRLPGAVADGTAGTEAARLADGVDVEEGAAAVAGGGEEAVGPADAGAAVDDPLEHATTTSRTSGARSDGGSVRIGGQPARS